MKLLYLFNPTNLYYYLKQRIFLYKTSSDVLFEGRGLAFNTIFEGKNKINGAIVSNSYIGFGTYVSGGTQLNRTYVGRFCSIGQNVHNSFGLHPSSVFVSTHPAFFSIKQQAGFSYVKTQKFQENKYADKDEKYFSIIENDVWIGNDVKIFGGITIHSGAIVGAGSIVTKDIPPYAIVAGVPARIIRYRFSQKEIEFLLNLKWWDKEEEWIRSNIILFEDVKLLMNEYKSEW